VEQDVQVMVVGSVERSRKKPDEQSEMETKGSTVSGGVAWENGNPRVSYIIISQKVKYGSGSASGTFCSIFTY